MLNNKIAILGATSHVAKGIIDNCLQQTACKLYLFARSPEPVKDFIKSYNNGSNAAVFSFDKFNNYDYNAIINCIGCGSPQKALDICHEILVITEKYDNLALDYLKNKPGTKYIYFSSGAVYGKYFENCADENTFFKLKVNSIELNDYYAISKINAEAKHRSSGQYNIIDLRLFAYFSRFIGLEDKFLITEIVKCLINKKSFITDSNDIVRDYIHPADLFQLILKCLEQTSINDVFDVFSKEPVSKFKILEYFKNKYGLNYSIEGKLQIINATGNKNKYYSQNYKAQKIGYTPQYTSLEAIDRELKIILGKVRLNGVENRL